MKNNNSKGMIVLLVGLAILSLATLVAMFFFFPKEPVKASTPPVATSPTSTPTTPNATPIPNEFDPVEWTRNSQAPSTANPSATTPASGDQGITVTLPSDNQGGAQTVVPSANTPATVSFPTDANPSAVQSHRVISPAPGQLVGKATARTNEVARRPAVKEREPNSQSGYWIQVASFKDRFQAANTEKLLEQQGLKGTLSTAVVKGTEVVRVRVGPYTNHAEAEKFLSWIKPLKAFSSSYITHVIAH